MIRNKNGKPSFEIIVRNTCLFLILNLFVVNLTAKEKDTLSIKEMHEDIEFYYSTIKKVHPRLYARYSAAEFDSLYNKIKNKCNRTLPITEFSYILDEFNGFTDGHTHLLRRNSTNQFFPRVNCIDGKIYLKNDVLISIEGIDAMNLKHKISSTISWEANLQKRISDFNFTLSDILTNYYKLKAPFKCQLIDSKKGEVKDTLIQAMSGQEWSLNDNPSRHPTYHNAMLHRAFYEPESIAVLYYNTSKIKEIPQKKYIQAIDDFFNEVKQKEITSLFIDVSQNGGGSDNVHKYILKHLRNGDFQAKMVKTGKKKFIWKLKRKKDRFEMKRKKDKFEGEVFVIMGPKTYSAGNDFCEFIKILNTGVLVGEPSGQYSPYSANYISGILPNSMFEYVCATTYVEFSPRISTESGFLQPDIPYPLTKPLELEDFQEIIRIYHHH